MEDQQNTENSKCETKEFTGRCHCGDIRYRVTGKIIKGSICKCRGCQLASGTLAVPFISVLRKDFTLTSGKPAKFRSDSDAQCDKHGEWHFCAKCGTQLYWLGFEGEQQDLFAGTLDDTSLFKETPQKQ